MVAGSVPSAQSADITPDWNTAPTARTWVVVEGSDWEVAAAAGCTQ